MGRGDCVAGAIIGYIAGAAALIVGVVRFCPVWKVVASTPIAQDER